MGLEWEEIRQLFGGVSMCGFCVVVVYVLLEHQGISLIDQDVGREKFLTLSMWKARNING